MSLNSLFTDIADAIREKKGTNDAIKASDFPSEISSIETGGGSLKSLFDLTKSGNNLFNGNTSIDEDDIESVVSYNDTENIEKAMYMFGDVYNLKRMPYLNFKSLKNANYMFNQCSNLVSVSKINNDTLNSVTGMFYYCVKLETIEELNCNNVYSFTNIFKNCYKLTNLKMLNIRANLQVGSGTSWGHLLTVDSLVGLCKECIKSSSSLTLTVGTANLEKLANVYVKFTDTTQTEIATGEKGEVVVCESTDTGAMLITDYMTLKNWGLA